MRPAAFFSDRRCRHQPFDHQGGELLPYGSRGDAQRRFDVFNAERTLLLKELENLPGRRPVDLGVIVHDDTPHPRDVTQDYRECLYFCQFYLSKIVNPTAARLQPGY